MLYSNPFAANFFPELVNCTICPRHCNADRLSGKPGYCQCDSSFLISSACIHKGEEPALSNTQGICNIFFSHCNLQCIYCQNYQISDNSSDIKPQNINEILVPIINILKTGIRHVGFVSPGHQIPQMKHIIEALKDFSNNLTFVYNSNGYDLTETLKSLEGMIDIYLPDFKYINPYTAKLLSGAEDYPEVAKKAIKEMYFQKGAYLAYDDNGLAESGLIIRHLILPGHIEESKNILKYIAGEISTSVNISIMSQYYPIPRVANHPILGRTITFEEYRDVFDEVERLGFTNGWSQEFGSHDNYLPNFNNENPFIPKKI